MKQWIIFCKSIAALFVMGALQIFTASLVYGGQFSDGQVIGRGSAICWESTVPKGNNGYWTVALLGTDDRDNSTQAGSSADLQIICSVNRSTGEIRMASVYRDTLLRSSAEEPSYQKSSQAFFVGGPEQLVKMLNENLDLSIDDYIVFSWKSVADAVNFLKGIELEISRAEFYYINAFVVETVRATGIASTMLKEPGMQHLDGVQTVAYARLRLMDSDFTRSQRHRKVAALVLEKAQQTDRLTMLELLELITPQLSTSMKLEDLCGLAAGVRTLHIADTAGFPFTHREVGMDRKGICVIPDPLEANVEELHHFLYPDRDYQCSDTVRAISKEILKQTEIDETH